MLSDRFFTNSEIHAILLGSRSKMQTSLEYDSLIYEGVTFPKTNPGHLATLSFLHGLEPTPPQSCRVLELGCGDGLNLLSQAYSFPESEFIGIDLSAAHIDAAQAAAAKIGASNANFLHADILALDIDQLGKFDYITAHGLYSWVPEQVRTRTLELYSECLSENGVGYISFNTYPGCRLREMLWDGLRYYTREIPDLIDKVDTARMFARVLQKSIKDDKDHKAIYAREIEKLEDRPVYGVAHDDLSPSLQPFYFHEFASHLEGHELQFVCESDPLLSFTGNYNEPALKMLDAFREDRITYEQTIDFIQCRRFRGSLVCAKRHRVEREVVSNRIVDMYLRSDLTAAASASDESFLDTSEVEFSSQHDESITIRDPFLKTTLRMVFDAWPRKVHYSEITSSLREIPPLATVPNFDARLAQLNEALKTLFISGCMRFSLDEMNIPESVGDRPRCSAFARLQVERGSNTICSLDGHVFNADDLVVRELVSLADGTRDRDQLVTEIAKQVEVEPARQAEFISALPNMIAENLEELRIGGVIVPEEYKP